MIHLTAFISPEDVGPITTGLRTVDGVRHVTVGGSTTGETTLLSVYLDPLCVDRALDVLSTFAIESGDVTIVRTSEVRLPGRQARATSGRDGQIWAEVGHRAGNEARVAYAYLVNTAAAGVVAAVGVVTGSAILVVGAMAISPDLMPIAATSVGLADRRWKLFPERRGPWPPDFWRAQSPRSPSSRFYSVFTGSHTT